MPMNGNNDPALEALIVAAFLELLASDAPSLSGPEPELDPEDERALDELGPNLVGTILEEEA